MKQRKETCFAPANQRGNAEQYIAASGRLHYAGGGRLWIVDPGRGTGAGGTGGSRASPKVADRFRTLREHWQGASGVQAGRTTAAARLDALLAGLVRSGALLARSDLLRCIQETPLRTVPAPNHRDNLDHARPSGAAAPQRRERDRQPEAIRPPGGATGIRRQRGCPGPAGHAGHACRTGPTRGLRGVLRRRGGKAQVRRRTASAGGRGGRGDDRVRPVQSLRCRYTPGANANASCWTPAASWSCTPMTTRCSVSRLRRRPHRGCGCPRPRPDGEASVPDARSGNGRCPCATWTSWPPTRRCSAARWRTACGDSGAGGLR